MNNEIKDEHLASNAGPTEPLEHGAAVHAPTTTDAEAMEREADRQAHAMGANLRQDVSDWAAGRDGASARTVAASSLPQDPAPAPKRSAPRAVRKPAAPVVEAPAAKTAKKPFSMSYAGVTTAQHIKAMLARGAR